MSNIDKYTPKSESRVLEDSHYPEKMSVVNYVLDNESFDSEDSQYSVKNPIIIDYTSENELNNSSTLESTEYDAEDEWGDSWSDHWGTLSDDEDEWTSEDGDIGEEWNDELSESNWTSITPDEDDPWPQLDSAIAWPDIDTLQESSGWVSDNVEAVEPKTTIMIDTIEKLDAFLPTLSRLKNGVELAFDCEGTPEIVDSDGKVTGGFGRDGDISFLSMTIASMNKTCIFDVWQLKAVTFERQNDDGLSLKKVLESQDRIQLWWDVRSDWDTLFHKFGIQIGKVRDVQLLELLSRSGVKSNICGLSRAMRDESEAFMGRGLDDWLSNKAVGGFYFKKNNWKPLIERPINETARAWEYVTPVDVAPTEDDMPMIFIDSIPEMNEFLPVLSNLRKHVPELFCGCKGNGNGLSRDGGISMFSMTIKSLNTTYMFDVQVLGDQVFSMVGDNGLSLGMILESDEIMQVWWDLRSDFEALSHHFNIYPRLYRDLQLLELMSSKGNRTKLNGLVNSVRMICIEYPDSTGGGYVGKWTKMKKEAREYFDYNGFRELETRPANHVVMQVCRGDTEIMPVMYDHLVHRLADTTRGMRMGSDNLFLDIVDEETIIRAEAVWSGESTNEYHYILDREIVNHPRTRSPPIFRMLPRVFSWGREDDVMKGME
ncbi:hypothetical protein SBOR_2336 [Sclerotinia borealis F-4128]|uniref:3'-5' exonuclease domain-containing protein n=1 Tax=Sclerotinia borealis (strain F-4128) TaxID=1432307 RepID=W9CKD4_SCLBF|nr:hypothetical protein SBOR_2336 [Sclerotinia borealis F-4128]